MSWDEGLFSTEMPCRSSIIESPRLHPPSSCRLSLLQSRVFHLPSSSPPHRSHELCTLSFNPPPKNIPEYMFFVRLLFCAVIVLHANFVALLNIFIAFHKSQKQRHHKWLHLCNMSEEWQQCQADIIQTHPLVRKYPFKILTYGFYWAFNFLNFRFLLMLSHAYELPQTGCTRRHSGHKANLIFIRRCSLTWWILPTWCSHNYVWYLTFSDLKHFFVSLFNVC